MTLSEQRRKAEQMTLRDLAKKVYETRWQYTGSGERTYRTAELFIDYVGNMKCAEVGTEDLNDWREYMVQKGNKDSTVKRYLSVVSTMLNEGRDLGVCGAFKTPKVTVVRDEPVFLTPEQETELLEHLAKGHPTYAAFASFLIQTGLRFSEALHLPWEEVNAADVYIAGARSKSRQGRRVPLTADAQALLRERGWPSDRFGRGPWDIIDEAGFRKAWTAARIAMGRNKDQLFTPHCLRHTCCSRLSQAGVAPRVIMEWMGHADLKTTLRYMHVRQEQLDEAAEALGSL